MSMFIQPYPNLAAYGRLTPRHMDWLIRSGVPLTALTRPPMVCVTNGVKGNDGLFDEDVNGAPWLVFPEAEDCIFWQPRSGELARWNGRAFAIGEDVIHAAATYSFGGNLNVFADPLDWLRADRDGVVILNWGVAFDQLRDCPRIAVAESLLDKLKHHLQPCRLPEILVLRRRQETAA